MMLHEHRRNLSGLVQEWAGSNVWVDVSEVEGSVIVDTIDDSDEHSTVDGWVTLVGADIWLDSVGVVEVVGGGNVLKW